MAEAYRNSEEIRGQGDAEATRIYKTAHNKDPQFYELTRTLDAYRKFLNDKTTVYLSSNWELLRLLTSGRKETPKAATQK
jgi:membrane protease subunit HflC